MDVTKLDMSDFDMPSTILDDLDVVLCTHHVAFLSDREGREKEISQLRLEFLHPTRVEDGL
jgi:hypothetical protein